MKNLILNIQLGVSGSMLIGAAIDLGIPIEAVIDEIKKININDYEISSKKVLRGKINGTEAEIILTKGSGNKDIVDIISAIEKSSIKISVKEKIIKIIKRLNEAFRINDQKTEERNVLQKINKKSIISICTFCITLDLLGINKIFYTDFPINLGVNLDSISSKSLTPAPEIIELLKGFKIKTDKCEDRIITAEAAAILTTIGIQIDEPLSYTLLNHGIGFDDKRIESFIYIDALLVETQKAAEEIFQIECNIDDMNPQIYPYLIERLMEQGALDAYISPIIMKKGRSGTNIKIIVNKKDINAIKEVIYTETTTLGIRIINLVREKLNREFHKIKIFDQEINIKIAYYNGRIINIQPEFEDCRQAACKTGKPLNDIILNAKQEYIKQNL